MSLVKAVKFETKIVSIFRNLVGYYESLIITVHTYSNIVIVSKGYISKNIFFTFEIDLSETK